MIASPITGTMVQETTCPFVFVVTLPWIAEMSSWPRPFTLKICSVMIAPPKTVGKPSAITVMTGVEFPSVRIRHWFLEKNSWV